MQNVYERALTKLKSHPSSRVRISLAKSILTVYNERHAFSVGEMFDGLDDEHKILILEIFTEYANNFENSNGFREVGRYCYDNFPRLIELSEAMFDARSVVRGKWERED